MKSCSTCKVAKPLDEFPNRSAPRDGKDHRCRACHRLYYLANKGAFLRRNKAWREQNPDKHRAQTRNAVRRHRYGIEEVQVAELYEQQNGLCAICETPLVRETRASHLDHCYDTGAIRGILCRGCNLGIGHLRHDVRILRNALEYLSSRE